MKNLTHLSNGVVKLSGIEYIGPGSESIPGVKLPPGRWAVKVYFLKYSEEIKQGPVLPEFIVTMNPENSPKNTYRNNINTWDQGIW